MNENETKAKSAFDDRIGGYTEYRIASISEAFYYQNCEIIRLLKVIAGEKE
jgi:hypothetical protein